jgi:hypothetical protein
LTAKDDAPMSTLPTCPILLPPELADTLPAAMKSGAVVPVLGPATIADVTHAADGRKIPAESTELILALNNGQPMAARLMEEFPRAAMHVELKRGRKALQGFLEKTYADPGWSEAAMHRWLVDLQVPYIIDLNRDTGLQKLLAATPHTLVVGCARIAGTAYRFKIFSHDGTAYREVEQEAVDGSLPILFKPLGTPIPQPTWIASDADYVDYITELMGGFAIPSFLKQRRLGLQYASFGLRLSRDTERMVLADLIWGAANPAGWALIDEPTPRERKFCSRLKLVLPAAATAQPEAA